VTFSHWQETKAPPTQTLKTQPCSSWHYYSFCQEVWIQCNVQRTLLYTL